MWVRTRCPLSNSTRNMALGRGSTTVPSTSMASFFATLRDYLSNMPKQPRANRPEQGEYRVQGIERPPHAYRSIGGTLAHVGKPPGVGPTGGLRGPAVSLSEAR